MTHSTIRGNRGGFRGRAAPGRGQRWLRLGAALFWLALWQAVSMAINQEILLVSPVSVLLALCRLAATAEFWRSIGFTFIKILGGFLLSMGAGVLLAALGCRYPALDTLLRPPVAVMKATPVASFTILALLWIRSQNLSVLVSFTMAFPIFYSNLREGIRTADRELLEMAEVFHIGLWRRALYLYLPAAAPFFISAASLCVGLCWKSGIAAEVIGQPAGSIGGALYQAKIFLATGDLFAWTAVIIAVSMLFERCVLLLIRRVQGRLEEV